MKNLFTFVYLLFLLILIGQQDLLSQDIILLQDGEEIECKVISINGDDVNFKKYSNMEGPLYTFTKSEIFMIKYENGDKEVFKTEKENGAVATEESKFSEFTDERDGKTYKTVKIGEQVWMAENLNFDSEGSRCYKNDLNICEKVGRLYTFQQAQSVCPEGWHLPSDDEWQKLEMELGLPYDKAVSRGWRGESPGQATMLKENGSSGMDVYFSGYYLSKFNSYIEHGKTAVFWTGTPKNKKVAWIREIKWRDSIYRIEYRMKDAYSVRCLKD